MALERKINMTTASLNTWGPSQAVPNILDRTVCLPTHKFSLECHQGVQRLLLISLIFPKPQMMFCSLIIDLNENLLTFLHLLVFPSIWLFSLSFEVVKVDHGMLWFPQWLNLEAYISPTHSPESNLVVSTEKHNQWLCLHNTKWGISRFPEARYGRGISFGIKWKL